MSSLPSVYAFRLWSKTLSFSQFTFRSIPRTSESISFKSLQCLWTIQVTGLYLQTCEHRRHMPCFETVLTRWVCGNISLARRTTNGTKSSFALYFSVMWWWTPLLQSIWNFFQWRIFGNYGKFMHSAIRIQASRKHFAGSKENILSHVMMATNAS